MRSVAGVLVSMVVLVGVAACAPATEPLPGLTASATATETPIPTPTSTPTVDYSNAELGIVFEDDPDLTGAEAEVYHWAAEYETEYWRTLTTNTVSPKFSTIASPEVQALMQQVVDKNVGIQAKIGGVFHVEMREITVDGETARAVACADYRDATFADATRSYTPDEAGFGGTTREELTLARVADQTWVVLTSAISSPC